MLTLDNPYYRQVRLMVGVLPFVARERCFALKGGTAINLFVRDLPRLSVDIDLAYLPVGERSTALREIDAAFRRIKQSLEGVSPAYAARIAKREQGHAYGMLVSSADAEIKVEVSPVLRCSRSRTSMPARSSPGSIASIRAISSTRSFCSGRRALPSSSSALFSSTSSATTGRSRGW